MARKVNEIVSAGIAQKMSLQGGEGYHMHPPADEARNGFMTVADRVLLNKRTSQAIPDTLFQRDAYGRAKVSAPSAPDDIARKQEVDVVSTRVDRIIADGDSSAEVVDARGGYSVLSARLNETDSLISSIYFFANKYPSFADVVYSAENVGGGTVFLPIGYHAVDTDLTIPDSITLHIPKGAYLHISDAVTITYTGYIDAGPYQIFKGSGIIRGKFLNQEVYPEWWGAKGDGITDDTTAIQRAIDTGSKVVLHGKEYITNDVLNITQNDTTIIGAGRYKTRIKRNSSGDIMYITGYRATIQDIGFNYSINPTSGSVLTVDGFGCTINGLWIIRADNGIRCLSQSASSMFSDMNIDNYSHTAFMVDGANDIILDSFIFNAGDSSGGALGGIRLQNRAEAIMVSNGDILEGVYSFTTDGATTFGGRPAYCTFTNVFFDSSINGALIDRMVSSKFIGCWFSNRPGNGATISNSEDILFSTCSFTNSGTHGAELFNTSKRVKFDNCSFIANNESNSGGNGLNIQTNTTDFSVIGCTATNGLGFPGQQGYGILVNTGSSDRYMITNNLVSGNKISGVVDEGSGTNKLVSANW